MFVSYLGLANFRNYAHLSLSLGPGATVFQGDNGQGKTNLLEAVYFLATTRSARASADRELISWSASWEGPAFARLESHVQKRGGELHLEILLRQEPAADGEGPAGVSKTIKVNGLPTRASQLIGQVNAVFFSPEDLSLAGGPPAGRRRYLDITNSQVNHLYLRALQRFNHVLNQRNHLLRQVRERRQPRELLDFWTEELVKAGTYVVRQRLEMIAAINRSIGAIYRQLAGGTEELVLSYAPSAARQETTGDAPTLAYRERLAEVQGREVEQGVTLIGPHRDDFTCLVGGVDVGTYGSRGQQRLAVLALKLAEAEYMQAQTEEEPILLLDDMLSELDAVRRQFVLARVGRAAQSLITTADPAAFSAEFLQAASLHRVERGSVCPESCVASSQ